MVTILIIMNKISRLGISSVVPRCTDRGSKIVVEECIRKAKDFQRKFFFLLFSKIKETSVNTHNLRSSVWSFK